MYTYTQDPAAVGNIWAFSNVGIGTRTANAATGLDGGTTAGIFRESATTGQHSVWHYDGGSTLTSGLFYAEKYYIKPVNRTRMRIASSGGNPSSTFYVDFTNVTISDPNWSIALLANGFYRLSRTFTATASGVISTIFSLLDSNGSDTYLGSTAAGWNLGGAQLEQVVSATSPSSTYMARLAGTAVSRSADALSFTLPAGVASMTYTFANGRTQLVSASPGAHTVPTTLTNYQIASFIDVDLTQVAAPVLSVAGRIGNVTLQQSDITGLKTTDLAQFSGVKTSGSTQMFGSATFRNESAIFLWATGGAVTTLTGTSTRGVVIGFNALSAIPSGVVTTFTNSLAIGTQAASAATTYLVSSGVGDTVFGSTTSVTNSNAFGNEAGNAGTVASSDFMGNLAGKGTGTAMGRVIGIGVNTLTFQSATDTVAVGANAGQGLLATPGAINQSVLIGAQTGNTANAGSTVTNLLLVGFNIQPPTASPSNWLNIGNAIRGDMAGGTYTITTQTGTAAQLSVANMILSGLPTSDPGVSGRVWNNLGILNISP